MEAVKPAEPPFVRPNKIYPTCVMEENARNRLIFSWRIANKFPIVIVITIEMISMWYHIAPRLLKTFNKLVTKTKTMAPFEMTDKNEVTAIGDPS